MTSLLIDKIFGEGRNVYLRTPNERDCDAFIRAVTRSYRLHHPWVSPPETRRNFENYLARTREERHRGALMIERRSGDIAGVINLNEIVRGAFGNAYLGYYCMHGFEGRGLMREGLGLMIDYAFGPLALHRLEANIQPRNRASIALVQGLGFSLEGLSPRYLKIDGDWRDHERYALLREEWRGEWVREVED